MRRDVQEIFRNTPHEKQVMMFSATLSKEIRPVCKKFMQDVITATFVLFLLRYINTTNFVSCLGASRPAWMGGASSWERTQRALLPLPVPWRLQERERKIVPGQKSHSSFHQPSTVPLPLPSAPHWYHQLLPLRFSNSHYHLSFCPISAVKITHLSSIHETTTVLDPAVILKVRASLPDLPAISNPYPDLHPFCTCPLKGANSTSLTCLGLGLSLTPHPVCSPILVHFSSFVPLPCLRYYSAKKGHALLYSLKRKKKKNGWERYSTIFFLFPAPWQVVHILDILKPTSILYPYVLYHPTHQHKTQTHLSNILLFATWKRKKIITPCGGSEKLAFKKPHRGRRRSYRKCSGVEERR